MRDFPLAKVYRTIEPGPVVLLTTADKDRPNVMTMSWHMMVEFEPPLIACIVSDADFSYAALRRTGECVIAIPAVTLADKVVKIGNTSGRDIDKFAKFGLTPVPAKRVRAPLIAECFINLECRNFRYATRRSIWSLHPQSGEGVDRSEAEGREDHPPSWLRRLRGGRRKAQAEIKDAIGAAP
jgi:Flavin reductase like domain